MPEAFDRDALALAEESAGIGVWSIDLTTSRVRGTNWKVASGSMNLLIAHAVAMRSTWMRSRVM